MFKYNVAQSLLFIYLLNQTSYVLKDLICWLKVNEPARQGTPSADFSTETLQLFK